MISEECDLERFIDVIVDLTYHEVLILTLMEVYTADDLIVHGKRGELLPVILNYFDDYSDSSNILP